MRTALIIIVSLFVYGFASTQTVVANDIADLIKDRNASRVAGKVIDAVEDIHKENEKTERVKIETAGKVAVAKEKTKQTEIEEDGKTEREAIETEGKVAVATAEAGAQAQTGFYTIGRRGGFARSRGRDTQVYVEQPPQVVYLPQPAPDQTPTLVVPDETKTEPPYGSTDALIAQQEKLRKQGHWSKQPEPQGLSITIAAEQAALKEEQDTLAALRFRSAKLKTRDQVLAEQEEIELLEASIEKREKRLEELRKKNESSAESDHWTENPPAPPATE